MNLLLVGNPNCGKSTLFNALTGERAKTGNWHGVTVGVKTAKTRSGIQITDIPGIYSLDAYSMEEKIAAAEIQSGRFSGIICVADALTLPRSLELVQNVLQQNLPVILAVTMADLLKKRGGYLDIHQLSLRLGIPAVCINAHRTADVRKLSELLRNNTARSRKSIPEGNILQDIYCAGSNRESLAETILYNPKIALPLFPIVFLAVFATAFAPHLPGTVCKNWLEELLSVQLGDFLGGAAERCGSVVGGAFLRAVCSGIGMLLSFLPQIAILNFSLFVMEESGYLSALAFLTDGLFRRIGLTGRAVFSVLMGFGCTAAAILTTRGLENKRLQTRAVTVLSYISCSAKMPVYLAVCSSFFHHPFLAVIGVYSIGVLFSLVAAFAIRGKQENLFVMEIAHLQVPDGLTVMRSLCDSLKQFVLKIVTVVSAVVIVLWFFLSFSLHGYVGLGSEQSMAAYFCKGICFLFYPMGIHCWKVALAACTGLIAKENVAGMLALFYGSNLQSAMSAPSAAAFVLFILMCTPCVSALAAASREIGIKRVSVIYIVQTVLAFLSAYLLYGMLVGGAFFATVVSVFLIVLFIILIPVQHFCRRKINVKNLSDSNSETKVGRI